MWNICYTEIEWDVMLGDNQVSFTVTFVTGVEAKAYYTILWLAEFIS